jgi:hypothetical protein
MNAYHRRHRERGRLCIGEKPAFSAAKMVLSENSELNLVPLGIARLFVGLWVAAGGARPTRLLRFGMGRRLRGTGPGLLRAIKGFAFS